MAHPARAVMAPAADTNTFLVATYNVRNWLAMTRWGRPDQPKPHGEKMAVVRYLAAIRPDVLALQEVGSNRDFAEIVSRLRNEGLVYPDGEWIQGVDTNRHVAILSRYPIISRNSRINTSYTIGTHTIGMSRGLLDVTIQVNADYQFRALVAHLKSKRPVPDINQATMRLEEARILRRHAETLLRQNSRHNLLVMGDLNDDPESEALAMIRGHEPPRLHRLEAFDRNGLSFTHFWTGRNQYSQIDYLLVNEAMQAELVADSAAIADAEGWEKASDHRAVYARFHALDRDAAASSGEAPPQPRPAPEPAMDGSPRFWPWLGGLAGAVVVILVAWRLKPRRPSS